MLECELTTHDPQGAVDALLSQAAWLPDPEVRGQLRRAAGFTQAQVAEAMGVGRVQVARWETGFADPSGMRRQAYSRLLRELMRQHPEATPSVVTT